ncbi:hypothetical protein Ahia01_000962300 [Argonauta hians]
MSPTLKDWDDHVDVDLVFRYLGRFGSYQIVQYVQILLGILPAAVNIFANVFTGFEPDYKCRHLDDKTLDGIHKEIDGQIKVFYDKCEINIKKINKQSIEKSLSCINSYNYSTGKYQSFISEWDLVCDQEEFSKLVTTVFHIGMMIGAALFPSLADKYGRKPVYVGARIASLLVNLMVLVSPSYSFLLVCRFLCGLLQPGMNVPGTIMIAELFPTENRTHVLLLGGVMWVSGVIMMAPIAYIFRNFNWRILHAVFALFFCPSLMEVWSLDESIRWLIAKDRWTEAKLLIRKAAKKNDVDYNQVAYLYRHFDPMGSEDSVSDESSQMLDTCNALVRTEADIADTRHNTGGSKGADIGDPQHSTGGKTREGIGDPQHNTRGCKGADIGDPQHSTGGKTRAGIGDPQHKTRDRTEEHVTDLHSKTGGNTRADISDPYHKTGGSNNIDIVGLHNGGHSSGRHETNFHNARNCISTNTTDLHNGGHSSGRDKTCHHNVPDSTEVDMISPNSEQDRINKDYFNSSQLSEGRNTPEVNLQITDLETVTVNIEKSRQKGPYLSETLNTEGADDVSSQQTAYINLNMENDSFKQADETDISIKNTFKTSQRQRKRQSKDAGGQDEDIPLAKLQEVHSGTKNSSSELIKPSEDVDTIKIRFSRSTEFVPTNTISITRSQDLQSTNKNLRNNKFQPNRNTKSYSDISINPLEIHSPGPDNKTLGLNTFERGSVKDYSILKRTFSTVLSSNAYIPHENLIKKSESLSYINKKSATSISNIDRCVKVIDSTIDCCYVKNRSMDPSDNSLQVDRDICNRNSDSNSIKCNGGIRDVTEMARKVSETSRELPELQPIDVDRDGYPPQYELTCADVTETAIMARSRCQLPGMLYIIKEPVLRRMIFICLYLWFVNTLVYYGLYFTSESLAGNRFLNFFLYALAEFPSQVLALKLLIRIGRKKTCILFQSIAGGSLIVAVIFRMSSSEDSYSVMAATVFSLIGMFGISGSFLVNWLYIPELFPTGLRNAGMGLASTASRIGSMLSPFSGILARYISWGPSVIFAFFCLVANLLVLALPETVHRQLPQSVGDIRRWSDEQDETWDSQTLQQMVRLIVMGSAQTEDRGRRS